MEQIGWISTRGKNRWESSRKAKTEPLNEETDATPKILSYLTSIKPCGSTLESNYRLLWIKGEISNFKAHFRPFLFQPERF